MNGRSVAGRSFFMQDCLSLVVFLIINNISPMKVFFLSVCFFLLTGILPAQTNYDIPLKTAADCKAAEPTVLVASDFILSKPMNDGESTKPEAFIWLWAQNSDRTVTIAGPITKISTPKVNTNLLWIFVACQAKYILEHQDKANDKNLVLVESYKMLADYVSNSENGVTINKNVQKLLDAKKNGTMDEYVKGK
jgi:hypothetical protein